jgi:hypothetical protein
MPPYIPCNEKFRQGDPPFMDQDDKSRTPSFIGKNSNRCNQAQLVLFVRGIEIEAFPPVLVGEGVVITSFL